MWFHEEVLRVLILLSDTYSHCHEHFISLHFSVTNQNTGTLVPIMLCRWNDLFSFTECFSIDFPYTRPIRFHVFLHSSSYIRWLPGDTLADRSRWLPSILLMANYLPYMFLVHDILYFSLIGSLCLIVITLFTLYAGIMHLQYCHITS